ncbi:acyl-CoA thioesterase [Rhodococcus sp. HNM0569]|uniref:hotdog domain-containing protein n=1 Tax=Rhodococcus sp. HNM0569 TaxID=2716340 RepID=UPI00146EE597|nr:acyl-CoA thioesterase [Rhodococcus sp. HNM0569]
MPARPRHTTLRFLAAPGDVGSLGDDAVHSGRILEWIDKAAYAQATGWSGTYCVTAYVGNVRFHRPVHSGQLVEVETRLVHTGSTSMHIHCEVRAADPVDREFVQCCECLVVFISMADGRPAAVPAWTPQSTVDRFQQDRAITRIGLRKDIEQAMAEQIYSSAGTAPECTMRFLASPSDVNWGGKVHGGTAMRWIDEAANACATGWAGTPTTSVYAGGVRFYRPIHIGHVVEVSARLVHTGKQTMHVSVHVRAGDPCTGALELTTHCLAVCAAVGPDGTPVPVPPWIPVSAEDLALDEHARHLIALRRRCTHLRPLSEHGRADAELAGV